MKILILDDNYTRLRVFQQKLIGHVVVCTTTVKEATTALKEDDFDVIFLDHDLNGEQNIPSGPGTGYEVAQWLHDYPEKQAPTVILHSLNETGRKNIMSLLPTAKELPGAWLYQPIPLI